MIDLNWGKLQNTMGEIILFTKLEGVGHHRPALFVSLLASNTFTHSCANLMAEILS